MLALILALSMVAGLAMMSARETGEYRKVAYVPCRSDLMHLTLPDFAVYDRGLHVHFVPIDNAPHVVDFTGECSCCPCTTTNIRRSGAQVLYVDHHRRPSGAQRNFVAGSFG